MQRIPTLAGATGLTRSPATAMPTSWQINAERLHSAVDDAHATGFDKGYRLGYVAGARVGRVAGVTWGLLIGAAGAAGVLWLNGLIRSAA